MAPCSIQMTAAIHEGPMLGNSTLLFTICPSVAKSLVSALANFVTFMFLESIYVRIFILAPFFLPFAVKYYHLLDSMI